ncbi:hypothetical protein V8E54_003625 [Elaphomyces granulatus]
MWMNTNPSIRKKNNEDQPEKYGNQLKMANPFYDSITARCSHIWITITAKDRHPWITAELNLTTVCKLQSDYGRGLSPSDYGFLLSQVESDTRLQLQSDYGRGLSPSDYGFLLSQVESDNRLQIAIGLRPRFVTLGLWLLAFAS